MYPTELEIKDATEINTSYLDLLFSIGGTVSCALPFTTSVTMSLSISQTFLSWLAIFHLRQPMVCLSNNSYGMPGLAPLMNVLIWERRDFHVSFSGKDLSGSVWGRPSGSSMVDMGISSNIIKSLFLFLTCCVTFWDMIGYSDILHGSDISLSRDFVTELDLIAVFTSLPNSERLPIEDLQRVRLVNRGRFLLRTPGPVPFGTCICANVETIHSLACHAYGPFEFLISLGPSIVPFKRCLTYPCRRSLHESHSALRIYHAFN